MAMAWKMLEYSGYGMKKGTIVPSGFGMKHGAVERSGYRIVLEVV
jgi:hypothetical protein